jgi:DNA-binding transcriptional LysR family regulator
LPGWLVATDVANGRLIHVLNQWDVTATSFDTAAWLVYPSRSYLPGKTRAMIDFLKGNIDQESAVAGFALNQHL